MKITKLGPIQKSDIEIKNLTIFTGENNQGKTYMSYALYGFLKTFEEQAYAFFTFDDAIKLVETGSYNVSFKEFKSKLSKLYLEDLTSEWGKSLNEVFQTGSKTFSQSKLNSSEEEIEKLLNLNQILSNDPITSEVDYKNLSHRLTLDKDGLEIIQIVNKKSNEVDDLERDRITYTIMQILLNSIVTDLTKTFYIPAERVGLNVFRSQLNTNKVQLFDTITSHMQSINSPSNEITLNNFSELKHYYPKPIGDYLNFINSIDKYDINDLEDSLGKFVRDKLINGRYDLNKQQDASYFRIKHGSNRYKRESIPLHITSSSIKSFYGLDYYLENLNLKSQNYLMIDEPEMNLHPKTQVEFIKFLDSLIAKGIRIIISTHSDFMIRKVQNLALKNKLDNNSEGINLDQIALYNFENNTVRKIDLLNDLEYENFNSTINNLEDEFLELSDQLAEKDELRNED